MDRDITLQIDQTRERARKIRQTVLLFPQVDHVLKEIQAVHRKGVVGHRAECVVLHGPSGAGKTQILRLYCDQHPPQVVETEGPDGDTDRVSFRKNSVLLVETPSPASRSALIDRIQASLESEQLPLKTTLGQRRERLIKMVRKAKVELLIIDEFQHLFDKRSQRVVQEAADLVKSLLNAAVCPIVLAGTPDVLKILQEATQLKTRMYSCPGLAPFNWENPAEQHLFCSYLAEIERALQFSKDSNLADPDRARRIHYISRGLIGEVARLLAKASDIATDADMPCITNDCLAMAVDQAWLLDESIPVNPFRTKHLPSRQVDHTV